ncbi:MAG: YgcG family protein [Betaproteobacteria bacterium]|nr:YgcG family protein [Betaproteobacteria bacterium]
MNLLARLPRAIFAVVLCCAALLPALAWGQAAVPPLSAQVTDLTRTLSASEIAALEQKLAAFEARKGSQIAVLLLPSTQPQSIEQFGIRVAEQWKLGRKGIDDGVIVLIARDDRTLRIEVGRGLEGVVPDAIAKRIISEDMLPFFKQGNFNAGINAGVDRLIGVIDGESLPPPRASARGQGASSGFDLGSALAWGAMLVVFVGGILRAIFGRFFGSVATGGIAGTLAYFLGASLVGGAIMGVIIFVLSLIGAQSLNSGGGRRGGHWDGGWRGGGWNSGGGGWSGGGGGFGGGGASGRW